MGAWVSDLSKGAEPEHVTLGDSIVAGFTPTEGFEPDLGIPRRRCLRVEPSRLRTSIDVETTLNVDPRVLLHRQEFGAHEIEGAKLGASPIDGNGENKGNEVGDRTGFLVERQTDLMLIEERWIPDHTTPLLVGKVECQKVGCFDSFAFWKDVVGADGFARFL